MPITRDTEVIGELFEDFFNNIFANDKLNNGFRKLDKVIEIVYRNPEMSFIINCRPGELSFDPDADGSCKPDVTIKMDWETAHQFWLGDLDILSAFFDQRIIVSGDAASLLDLKPLFKEASAIYKVVSSRHITPE